MQRAFRISGQYILKNNFLHFLSNLFLKMYRSFGINILSKYIVFIQQAMIEYKESKFNSKASFYASQGEMCKS